MHVHVQGKQAGAIPYCIPCKKPLSEQRRPARSILLFLLACAARACHDLHDANLWLCHPPTTSTTGCSTGMQVDDYGSTGDGYSLPNQPMRGTVAQCAAACTAAGDCRVFSWQVGVRTTTTADCYLKTANDPGQQMKGKWTTFIVTCSTGTLLPHAMRCFRADPYIVGFH